MKEEWEILSSSPPSIKPSRQTSIEAAISEDGKGSDTYCYELLSMLIGLSQSEVGCAFLAEQEKLIQDLFTLLHVGTVRLQLQVSGGLQSSLCVRSLVYGRSVCYFCLYAHTARNNRSALCYVKFSQLLDPRTLLQYSTFESSLLSAIVLLLKLSTLLVLSISWESLTVFWPSFQRPFLFK